MQKNFRFLRSFLWGAAWGALAVFSARLLIRYMGRLAASVGSLAGLDADMLFQITQPLSQLQQALIISPWIPFVLLAGILFACLAHARKVWLSVLSGVILFLPTAALALWYTRVNTIRVGALVRCVLPLVLSLF